MRPGTIHCTLPALSLLTLGTLAGMPHVLAQPGGPMPPLADCGEQPGGAEVICGTRAPEDFEVTPDGRFLIIANYGRGEDMALDMFDLDTRTFTEFSLSADRQPGWGEDSCTESIGEQVSPHGLSLTRRDSGEWQFYVVNHNVRESMEMYELQQSGGIWSLVWRGCVLAEEPYNDVTALPDGSFVATRPQAIQQQGQNLFAGDPSGNVAVWTAAEGETVLPGTEYGYPNGVVVSADGRYAFISGWTTSTLHMYDLEEKREAERIDLSFMPDNLTWTTDGTILAAGIRGVAGTCPADSGVPCIQVMAVAEVIPDALAVTWYHEEGGLISGTSVAIEAGDAIYVGSFQGDRMVEIHK